MSKLVSSGPTDPSRRAAMHAAAGLTIAYSLPATAQGLKPFSTHATGAPANMFVHIGSDGWITIANPASEMGQGILTSNAMLVAEELDANWSKVRVEQSPNNTKAYGNPAFGGAMAWGGSRSTQGMFMVLRLAGAQARLVLLQAAAERWAVPVASLVTEPSIVVHRSSGQRLSYGELAAFVPANRPLPTVGEDQLKKRSEFRIIGRSMPRLDVPDKVSGGAVFGIDVQVPGMFRAGFLRPPSQGASIEFMDDSAAKAIAGVMAIVLLPSGIGVVADSYWTVQRAKQALNVRWKAGEGATYSSRQATEEFAAAARIPAATGVTLFEVGSGTATPAPGTRTLTAEYATDHVYHGQLEPMNAVASVSADGLSVELWLPTQVQTACTAAVAGALKIAPEKVLIHTTLIGGGFGRRLEVDYAVEAALLSSAVRKPVQVIWSREEDVLAGRYRPLTLQRIEAKVLPDGSIDHWDYRLASDSWIARANPGAFKALQGKDPPTTEGSELTYPAPNQRMTFLRQERPRVVGNWRAVGEGYTKFAQESMIDEIAAALAIDPVAYRLARLAELPRCAAVLREVASRSNWQTKPSRHRALGVACGFMKTWNAYAATVVDVELDPSTGALRVHKLWMTVDAGLIVHPSNALAQLEGGALWGISAALYESIEIKEGVPQASNFHDYRPLRMGQVPELAIKLIESENKPGGIGEVGLPMVAPAIVCAVARLTGKRLRHLPMMPERVLAALRT